MPEPPSRRYGQEERLLQNCVDLIGFDRHCRVAKDPVGADGKAYDAQLASDRERFERAAKQSGAKAS